MRCKDSPLALLSAAKTLIRQRLGGGVLPVCAALQTGLAGRLGSRPGASLGAWHHKGRWVGIISLYS